MNARPRRGMWLTVALITAVAVLGTVGTHVYYRAFERHDRTRQTYPADATGPVDPHPVRLVEIDAGEAQVGVAPGPAGKVTVASRETWTLKHPRALLRAAAGVLRVEADCVDGQWPLRAPQCVTDLDVRVPPGTAVRITGGSGGVEVRGLRGDVDVRVGSGSVLLDGLSGRITARSDSGSVEAHGLRSRDVTASGGSGSVRLAFAAAPDDVTARVDSGSLDVRLPPGGPRYRVVLSRGSGTVTIPHGLADSASARTLDLATGSGTVTVER